MAGILIADSDDRDRGATAALCRAAGHHTVEVTTGVEAVRGLTSARVDVVLLDDALADPDSYDTCRALRAHPHGMTIPVVFTSTAPAHIVRAVVEVGGDDLVGKPLLAAEVEHRIRVALAVSEARRAERVALTLLSRRCEELARSAEQHQALTEFLVHDLKSPLTSVAITLQELLERGVPEACSVPLRSCLSATDNVGRMVMNLLDLSAARRLDVQPAACDVDALLAHLSEHFALRLEVRGVTLRTRSQLLELWADRDLLRRISENLVDNALRYARTGTTIDVDVEAQLHGGVLTVTDRGPGVPPAHRERVFDRFVQLDPEASQRASRGLGLAFCRLAVDAHGGRIWVEDAPDGGARFRALFPGPVVRRC